MEFRELLPEPGVIDLGERLEPLIRLGDEAPEDRPYAFVNFVATVDGRATVKGRSGGLGDDGDKAVFHGLRETVDAVLAGTGTLREERYGRILGKAERRERRVARGQTPEPLACTVTRSGTIPTGIPLFAEPEAQIIVFSARPVDVSECAAQVTVIVLDDAEQPFTAALRALRREYGVKTILCEGGPTVFSALLHENLVDELFLTVAPKLAGGGYGPAIAFGAELAEPASLTLQWLLERGGSLFHRYVLR